MWTEQEKGGFKLRIDVNGNLAEDLARIIETGLAKENRHISNAHRDEFLNLVTELKTTSAEFKKGFDQHVRETFSEKK